MFEEQYYTVMHLCMFDRTHSRNSSNIIVDTAQHAGIEHYILYDFAVFWPVLLQYIVYLL